MLERCEKEWCIERSEREWCWKGVRKSDVRKGVKRSDVGKGVSRQRCWEYSRDVEVAGSKFSWGWLVEGSGLVCWMKTREKNEITEIWSCHKFMFSLERSSLVSIWIVTCCELHRITMLNRTEYHAHDSWLTVVLNCEMLASFSWRTRNRGDCRRSEGRWKHKSTQ